MPMRCRYRHAQLDQVGVILREESFREIERDETVRESNSKRPEREDPRDAQPCVRASSRRLVSTSRSEW